MDRATHLAAVYLIIRDGNKLLLLRRFNTGYEDGNYGFVAGHIDAGESAEQALVREAQEEAGLVIDARDIQLVHCLHRQGDDGSRFDLFFEAAAWRGEPINCEPNKCDDLGWYSASELPSNTIMYIREALQQIDAGQFYSQFGWEEAPLQARKI